MKKFGTLLLLVQIILTSLCFLHPHQAFANIRPKIEKLVQGIAKDNSLDGEKVGFAGTTSEQYKRFVELKFNATGKELRELTDHKNAVVRCYAFQGLVDRKDAGIFPILLKHITDYTKVWTVHYDSITEMAAGDYFFGVVSSASRKYPDGFRLTDRQQEKISDIFIFQSGIELRSRQHWFVEMKPKKKYYQRIKEIYQKENNMFAFMALAKFHKDDDLKLIAALLKSKDAKSQRYGLLAAMYYPHPSLFPLIKKIHQAEIKKNTDSYNGKILPLYLAIVQYKNAASRALLEETIAQAKGDTLTEHALSIEHALEKHPSRAYNGISQKLKLSRDEINGIKYALKMPDYFLVY